MIPQVQPIQQYTPPPPPPPPPPQPIKDKQAKKKHWTIKQKEVLPVQVPKTEEYNEIRSFEITSLPFVTPHPLKIPNCISAELVRAIIPRNEYVIDSTENTFTLTSATNPSAEPVTITVTVGDYNIAELVTEITTQVQSSSYSTTPGSFTAIYNATTSSTTFVHAGSEDFDVKMNPQLAYSLGFSPAIFSSTLGTVTGSNKVDLFGNRTILVTTPELGGPDGHYKNILQEVHLKDDLTWWQNTLNPRWTERRFRQPRHIGHLNISLLSRHPSQTSDADYTELALNGTVAHLTVCFRCLRYSHEAIQTKELDLS
jgi:hypothetical protein